MAITAGTAILAGGALGALSGLFGDKEKKTSTQVQFPAEYQPLAGQTGALAQNILQRPGQFWTAQRSAGPSAMRLASFGKAAEIGTGQGLRMGDRIGALMDVAGNQENINKAMSGLSTDEINERMNPYVEGWIQKTLDASDRGADRSRARRAALRAGMPGSRGLMMEAQAETDYLRDRDLLTSGMHKSAYERSEDVLERERERLGRFDIQNRTLAGTLSTTASRLEDAELDRQIRKMGALRQAGAEQEAFQNRQIQDRMDLFNEVRGYPESRVNFGSSVVSGLPVGQTTIQPTGRDIASSTLGGALTVAGLGLGKGRGTVGSSFLSSLGLKHGGRLPLAGGGAPDNVELTIRMIQEFEEAGAPLPPELEQAKASLMQGAPPTPLPQPRPLIPMPPPTTVEPALGALSASAGIPDVDATLPTTRGVPGRQMDTRMGAGALGVAAAPPAAPAPAAAPGNPVAGALKHLFGRVNPSTGNSVAYNTGLNLLALGGGSPDGVNRGPMANLAMALKGAEKDYASGVKEARASALAARKIQSERELAVATLRAKYGGPQSSEGKLFSDWQAAVGQYGADSEQAKVLEQILIEKGSDPEKLSNVSRMMAERAALDPEDPEYAQKKQTLTDAINKASTSKAKGEKLRSMNVQLPDGRTFTVMTDAGGNDYVNMDGKRVPVGELPAGTETFTPVSPTKTAEARANQQRLKALRGTIDNVRNRVAALTDDQLGLTGALRTAGAEFAGMLGDVAGLVGYKDGQSYMNDMARAAGGGENLKTVPVLENTLFELMMAHKKAVTGTTRILKEQQQLIKDQVSLQGIKSAAGIRARVEEVLKKIEQGTYDQEVAEILRGGGTPSAASNVSKADKIVGIGG